MRRRRKFNRAGKYTSAAWHFFLAACLLLGAGNAVCSAQSPVIPLPVDAQKAVADGLAAATQQDWVSAIQHFSKARESAPSSPHVLFNLALANDSGGNRELFAVAWYRAYLAAAPRSANAGQVQSRIADLESAAGEKIRTLIRIAGEAIPGISHAGVRDLALESLAKAQAKAGDIDAAARTSSAIVNNPLLKTGALLHIARAQFDSGDVDGACSSLGTAGASIRQAMATPALDRERWDIKWVFESHPAMLAEAVEQLVNAGKTTNAIEMASGIDGTNYPALKAKALEAIVKAQAEAGDREGAKRAAEAITLPDWKAVALIDVVIAQAQVDDIGGALNTTAGMATGGEAAYFRAIAYHYVASRQIKTGDRAGALKTLSKATGEAISIQDSTSRDRRFVAIAEAQAEAGDIRGACDTVDRIESKSSKPGVLAIIAGWQWKSGDKVGAKKRLVQSQEKAAEITDKNHRSFVCRLIAQKQAEAGDFAGASATAGRIVSNHQKSQFYKEFAQLQKKAGNAAGAEKALIEMAKAFTEEEITFWSNTVLQRLARVYSKGSHTRLDSLKGLKPEELYIPVTTDAETMATELKFIRDKASEWRKVWTNSVPMGAP